MKLIVLLQRYFTAFHLI